MHHHHPSIFVILLASFAAWLALAVSPVAARTAQVSAEPVAAPVEPNARRARLDPVEAKIRDLHDRLQISPVQDGQWEGVARVMRGNARALTTLMQDLRRKPLTAVEELRAYQTAAAAHAKASGRLADAFDVLYRTMSEEQRRNADVVLRQSRKDLGGFH